MTPITQHESEQASTSAVGSVHDKDLTAAIALRRPATGKAGEARQ